MAPFLSKLQSPLKFTLPWQHSGFFSLSFISYVDLTSSRARCSSTIPVPATVTILSCTGSHMGELCRVGELLSYGWAVSYGEIRHVGELRHMGEIRHVGELRHMGEISRVDAQLLYPKCMAVRSCTAAKLQRHLPVVVCLYHDGVKPGRGSCELWCCIQPQLRLQQCLLLLNSGIIFITSNKEN